MAATLGSAYVQIVPSARGISGTLSKIMNKESAPAGEAAGTSLAGGIKGMLLKAGIGAVVIGGLKKSLTEGAALEQSIGGIQTLFKKNANDMIKNADEAYRTAGISANKYMEQATSFSASLLQSVGGDTAKAAKDADMAIIDMGDNANKMGSNIEDIQNAYQGFAKQNYTMLDNLKLGYGGTKTEMQRLLADASKISGQKYDISNLSDVYNAIHVVQGELGITGTTAKEAEATLSGSFASMKAAASNFMGNLALGRNLGPSLEALVKSTGTFLFKNLFPAVGRVFISLPIAIRSAIKSSSPGLMSSGMNLIKIISTGVNKGFPQLLNTISAKLPEVLKVGGDFIIKFASGILKNAPKVYAKIGTMITNLINTLVKFFQKNGPAIAEQGGQIVGKLVIGLVKNLPKIVVTLLKVVGKVTITLMKAIPKMAILGTKMMFSFIKGLGGSVLSQISTVMNRAKESMLRPLRAGENAIRGIIQRIKSFFNVTLSFNGIRLPHITVSWDSSGALGKIASKLGLPGVPDFGVRWYAKGGIFDAPSVIGVGEAGREAVVPIDKLSGIIREAYPMQENSGGTYYVTMYVSGAESPESWADKFSKELRRQVRMGG